MDFKKEMKAYLENACKVLMASCVDELEMAADELLRARRDGNWIFVAGNGGSASTAAHFANDFVKGLSVDGKPRFKAMALCDSVAIVTCLANDFAYEECFTEQMKNYVSKGDVLVVYSGSGNSPNIVNAVKYAKSKGMSVIAFLGRDGGEVKPLSDINCVAATDDMGSIEDVHMTWEHALVNCIRQRIAEE